MTEKDDKENKAKPLKGPGGLTMRQIHEQVKLSKQRDQQAQNISNQRLHKQNRWQRFMHYVWDKKKGG